MYFDRYSITSLRYIDISFKNFMAGNLAAGLYIVEPQFRKVLFVFSMFRSFQSCFVCFLQHPLLSFFALPFGWECKGKDLFRNSK